MRRGLVLMCLVWVLGLGGCKDETPARVGRTPPKAPAGTGSVHIEYDVMPSILFEAESGKVTAPMAVFEDAECSGGRYVLAPEGPGYQEINIGGNVVYSFAVKEAGRYTLWLRTRFSASCGNSLGVMLDGGAEGKVEDAIYKKWHWVPLRGRRMDLAKGTHVLVITNREDGAACDQILLARDAEFRPAGVEKADVAQRTSGMAAAPPTAQDEGAGKSAATP